MLLVHTKNQLQIKGFLYFCVHPCSGKKDILLTFSEPCYCHVGEGLAGQPLQKAGQVNAHAAAVGPQGSDEKAMKICSCRSAWWFHIVLYLTVLGFFDKNTFGHISYVFHLFFNFFLTDQYGYGVLEKLVSFGKNHRYRRRRLT